MEIPLAKKHKGLRVDHSGLLERLANGCKIRPDQRYMLGELDKHLVEMGKKFYEGEISIVDEFLQLYCLDGNRPGNLDSSKQKTELEIARDKIKKADNVFLCIIGTILEREGMTDIEDMCHEAIDMLRGNDQG